MISPLFNPLQYPVIRIPPVTDLTKKTESFQSLHNDCEQTWLEPVADQSQSVKEKSMWWIANGEHGMSSKTMWNCFMDNHAFPINHPHDPDDFSRCYKLLEVVPEWKNELSKLKTLSHQWSALVDNWDELTRMYELNFNNNWKNSEQIGMYKFMQKLITDVA